jgi:sulfite exporter TauE/SafE
MLSSIHPLGERVRGNRWAVTVALFTAASTIAGAAVGAALGAAGALVAAPGSRGALAAAAVAGVAALALDASGRHRSLARPRRQVDETWLTAYRRWVYAAGWGAQLGSGVLTVVPAALGWLVLALAALSASPSHGAAVVGLFGLVRGLTLLSAARVSDPVLLRAFHAAMAARSSDAHRLAVGADALVALVAATAVVAASGAG